MGTGERRRIDPAVVADSAVETDSLGSSMIQDLSWRPVSSNGQIWAAYVRDSSGIQDIFLYEVLSGRHYCLICVDSLVDGESLIIWGTPSWSPDGQCLTFSAAIDGDAGIYIVRDMDGILKNPEQLEYTPSHVMLIDDEGSQFGAAWCPAPGSGFLVYTDQRNEKARLRIRMFDPLTSKSFDLLKIDTTINYFAPTWNAGGNRIAFYRHGNEDGALSRFSGPAYGKLEVGIASVDILQDSVVLSPLQHRNLDTPGIVEVLPNYDRLLGPAWLLGGKHLVVSTEEEPKSTRLRVVSLPEWEAGEAEYDFWLRGFGGDRYDYPRDLNIVNRNIAFTFEKISKKYLLVGQMVPSLKLVIAPEYIDIPGNRRTWWKAYAAGGQVRTGFLNKLGDFLWSPIAGPDIGINKGIVPVAGGVALLIALMGGGGDDVPESTPRDWTPPEFPDPRKAKPGFRITIGF
jgi:hypothetical protein